MCGYKHAENKSWSAVVLITIIHFSESQQAASKIKRLDPRGHSAITTCTHTSCCYNICLSTSLAEMHVVTHTPPYHYHNISTMGCCCVCILHILGDYGAKALKRCLDYSELGPLCTDGGSPGQLRKPLTEILFNCSFYLVII